MKLAAIQLGKVTWLAEAVEFDPKGKLFLPDFLASIASLGEFRVFPDKSGQYSEKGANFEIGKLGDQRINKLQLFNDGIVMETSSPTQDAERSLLNLMLWAKDAHGVTFEPGMIRRKMFYSEIIAFMDVDLNNLHPVLRKIGSAVSESVTAVNGIQATFRASGVTLEVNSLTRKFPVGQFSVQRRADTPDAENKYFSSAPLKTDEHIRLLEQFEIDVSGLEIIA